MYYYENILPYCFNEVNLLKENDTYRKDAMGYAVKNVIEEYHNIDYNDVNELLEIDDLSYVKAKQL